MAAAATTVRQGAGAQCAGSAAASSMSSCRRAASPAARSSRSPDALCGRCWGGITFFAPPWCAGCGLPFAHPMGDGRGLRRLRPRAAGLGPGAGGAALRQEQPPADPRRSSMPTARMWRRRFGRWMRRAGGEVLAGGRIAGAGAAALDAAVSSAATTRRRCWRTRSARAGGPPVAADCLVRRRRTPSQGHLGPLARERNVRGAFAVRRPAEVAGRRLVLIDDVMTTGATVDECARVLKRAGAACGRRADAGAGVARSGA